MVYRTLDNCKISTSLLGFGCMRFPTTPDGNIDEKEASQMLDKAIASGVTYIDTAYPYHNGESEPFVGKALKKYSRESFYLATKLPMWNIHTLDEAKEIFAKQLDRLQTDYIDFYLFHALDKNHWSKIKDLKLIPYFEELKKEGKIKHLGFSFHDDYSIFETILKSHSWDFCQIQLNYMDTEIQAGMNGYELTEKLGIPLIIMEPIKGGTLANLPKDIDAIFKNYDNNKSTSSWALRWVASLPNVKVILSGMSNMKQVEDNLSTFRALSPLSAEEDALIKEVTSSMKRRTKNGCTACRYCMPCPFGINIPSCFSIWNHYSMYDSADSAKRRYFKDLKTEERADMCKQCGKCETSCPQNIPIREHLKQLHHDFEIIK